MFSTQIALMHNGRVRTGVSSAPIYGEVAYAEARAGRLPQRQADRRQQRSHD